MQQLIGDLFMQAFANPRLAEQEDQARLDLAALAARRPPRLLHRQLRD